MKGQARQTVTADPSTSTKTGGCGSRQRNVALPVIGAASRVRPSRMGVRRAAVLLAVHVLMIAHVVHWFVAGYTVSPIEPSEAMYTLNQGHLNAGFVFFATAIVATLIFGRFVCGWGCHFIAYQDACLWVLKKMRIKPKPLRARLLILGPLALALYMFVWPSAYRWWAGGPAPRVTNHLLKTDFWETFPGPLIAIATVLVGGFAIVYFLGAKGFCTYACPYGAFFGLADRFARGRIRVTDACEHCGHCTSVCSSNVRVHEEVARHGMVVDPGCMKCMDCVSVCPNDALYFGFTAAVSDRSAGKARPKVPYDFTLGEELFAAGLGLAALLAFRGLYDQIPLLMAMAMAAVAAFVGLKLAQLTYRPNVRLQRFQLRKGRMLTRAGVVFMGCAASLLLFTAWSGAVQYSGWRGGALLAEAQVGDEVWLPGNGWWAQASFGRKKLVDAAIRHLERAHAWSLGSTYRFSRDLVWAYLARQRVAEAESLLNRMVEAHPNEAGVHRGLAALYVKKGEATAAEIAYRRAMELNPAFPEAFRELMSLLVAQGQLGEAIHTLREGFDRTTDAEWIVGFCATLMQRDRTLQAIELLKVLVALKPDHARAHWSLGVALMQIGGTREGIRHLREAVRLDPTLGEARYDLGMALLKAGKTHDAIEPLRAAVRQAPDMADAHYNLAVAYFMTGNLNAAVARAKRAVEIRPDDPLGFEFLAMVLTHLGREDEAQVATAAAEKLRGGASD